jgi:hypothetical protein
LWQLSEGRTDGKTENFPSTMEILLSGTPESLHDFIFESNKQGQVIFVSSAEEAMERFRV